MTPDQFRRLRVDEYDAMVTVMVEQSTGEEVFDYDLDEEVPDGW